MAPTARQSTLIAVCFIVLIGAIAITALTVYEADDFLKIWAVIGTLLGVVTGAVPSFFFAVSAGKSEEERSHAEAKVQTVLGLTDSGILSKAAELRPDLFAGESSETAQRSGMADVDD